MNRGSVQAGSTWELPQAPPGAPQGIARNWVTPQPPSDRNALAQMMLRSHPLAGPLMRQMDWSRAAGNPALQRRIASGGNPFMTRGQDYLRGQSR